MSVKKLYAKKVYLSLILYRYSRKRGMGSDLEKNKKRKNLCFEQIALKIHLQSQTKTMECNNNSQKHVKSLAKTKEE